MPFIGGETPRNGTYILNFFKCQPALNYGFYKTDRDWQQPMDAPGPIATREALKDIMRFWLAMGCDGFRVDMAGSLVKHDEDGKGTIALWQNIREFLNKEFPDAAMVSEWGEPDKSLIGGFHMDFLLHFGSSHYNDLFRCDEPYFSKRAKGSAKEFIEAYKANCAKTDGKGLICIPSGNHDMDRLARALDVDELRVAFAFLLSMPGAPFIYYGDEIGMQGYRDPFNRAFFCWDSHEKRLRPVLAQLAQLRHSCEAFRTGELRVLRAEDGILHYQRIGKTETAEIIVNRSEHIIVEPLASGKHTEVNPMGFTIVVEENGHNPNHSYYDIQ